MALKLWELTKTARDGKLTREDTEGAMVTITIPRSVDIDGFRPTTNPPWAAIWGVCWAVGKPADYRGEIIV